MARTKGSITRCGYCNAEGHNKRTCPDLKAYANKNPDSYTARRMKQNKDRASKRQCSYCSESGHNRKTCETYKRDHVAYGHMNRKYQNDLSNAMQKQGLGAGSIVRVTSWSETKYWLITKVNWNNINIANWFRHGMNQNDQGGGYPFEAIRVDLANVSDYDRRNSYGLKTSLNFGKIVFEKAEMKVGPGLNAHLDFEIVGPVEEIDTEFDRNSGDSFMISKEYTQGYASSLIEKIKKEYND